MGDFAQGFVQGLANQLSTDINTRRQEARDFFNKQVEVARTTGLENRRRVRTAVEGSTSVARQLNQMGVPKDIIMAVANQNPEDLGTFYEQVSKAQAAGIQTDEEFFRGFVEVGGNFMAPDEDFQTFFTRMYEPVVENASQNPEAFNEDKRGGIFASMFGLNSMDRARQKLGETEIVDGLTAEQLLQYGDEVVPNRVGGDATVTFDYNRLAQEEAAAGGGDLSISEINSINTRLQDVLAQVGPMLTEGDPSLADNPAALTAEKNRKAYEVLSEEFQGIPGVDSYLRRRLNIDDAPTDAAGEALDAPEVDPATEPTPDPTDAAAPPPDAPDVDTTVDPTQPPIDPSQEPELAQIETDAGVLTFYQNAGPGLAVYTDEQGNEVTLSIAQVRAYARQ